MIALTFDTETTGLINHPSAKVETQPRIIEIGGVLVDEHGKILQEYSAKVNPGCRLEAVITKITGLTDEDLTDEPPFSERLPELRELFAAADIFVAHNAPFDKGMMTHELKLLGIDDFPWPSLAVCTVQEFAELWGRRPKLTELYEFLFNKKLEQKHRALDDALALTEIVIHEKIIARCAAAIARPL